MKEIASISALAMLLLAVPSARATIHDIPPNPLVWLAARSANKEGVRNGAEFWVAFVWHISIPDKSEFVQLPAKVGGWIEIVPGAIIGFVPGAVTLHPSDGVFAGAGIGCFVLASVTSAPFCILKKIFYDGPRRLFRRSSPRGDILAIPKPAGGKPQKIKFPTIASAPLQL